MACSTGSRVFHAMHAQLGLKKVTPLHVYEETTRRVHRKYVKALIMW